MIATWVALLLALAAQVVGAVTHRGWLGWYAAPTMVVLIALNFMRLRSGSDLSRIFAIAGLFWVLVLFGLGGADLFRRRDEPVGRAVGVAAGDQAVVDTFDAVSRPVR